MCGRARHGSRGHGGTRSLFALLPGGRRSWRHSGLAAGGIADRRGVEADGDGAAGVLVGTRFSASDEALTAPRAKQRIVETGGDATVRTTVFDVVRGYDAGWAGITGRALRNRFIDAWHGREEASSRVETEERKYWQAVERQDFDAALVSRERRDLIDSVLPAAEIVRRMVADGGDEARRPRRLR